MKRKAITLLACVFALTLALCLTGCASEQEESQQNEPTTAQSSNEAEPQDLIVSESGYYADDYNGYNYAAIIENPNTQWAAENITLTVTGRDADGNVVDSQSDYTTLLFADGKTAICGTFYPPEAVADIDFSVSVPSSGWQQEELTMEEFTSVLTVDSINDSVGSYGDVTFAGEVTNSADGDFSSTRVNIVLRDFDGNITGGYFTYLDSELAAGATKSFSISTIGAAPSYETIEAYIDCGLPLSD